ncbi:MAG: hypothetical protein GXO93_04085 [FCB group bacterium]|nr:hypothetical protein [FCB group bacterium]
MAELYLVEFKGWRKEYFFNTYYHSLKPTDYVIIQADRGEDIGLLSKKITVEVDFEDTTKPRSILRRASDADMVKYHEIQEKEIKHKAEVEELIRKHGLMMKVVDIEWQFDGNRMTIFFTADHRVDFRELVKDLAAKYKTRIELRQIGVRDEARRIGGIGICGLQQCCNTFIKEFTPITTQHAREQDLPLNPSKISGNCGRLLCCLRYEADLYELCKAKFPPIGALIRSKMGNGVIERIDIFNEEAVIRVEEGVLVRSSAEDIVVVDTKTPIPKQRSLNIVVEIESETEKDEQAQKELKKLDDADDV